MSSDEYVPTISELRDFCVEWGKVQHPHIDPRKTGEAFDRALAAHDAVVERAAAAKALRQAAYTVWVASPQGPESEDARDRIDAMVDALVESGEGA
jgi:hypothetical protein